MVMAAKNATAGRPELLVRSAALVHVNKGQVRPPVDSRTLKLISSVVTQASRYAILFDSYLKRVRAIAGDSELVLKAFSLAWEGHSGQF